MAKKYIIVAPPFGKSNGVRALYNLAKALKDKGFEAYIYTKGLQYSGYKYINKITNENRENDIVIYPETTYFNPLRFKNVVRWVLYYPGILAGTKKYHHSETIFTWLDIYYKNVPELRLPFIDEDLFFKDDTVKTHDSYFVHKGGQFGELEAIKDAVRIDMNFPSTRQELAKLLRSTKIFYSFDANTAMLEEAALCGAKTMIITNDGIVEYKAHYAEMFVKENCNAFLEKFIEITQALDYKGEIENYPLGYNLREKYLNLRTIVGKILRIIGLKK